MYAIVFELEQDTLVKIPNYQYVCANIEKALAAHGFTRQQGSVYFGDVSKVDAVSCVLAVMDLAKNHPWFALSVSDIRMLRIEEISDLMPAVRKAVALDE